MSAIRWMTSSPLAAMGMLIALTSLVFGIFVAARSSNRSLGRAWFIFALSAVGWGLGTTWIANATSPEEALRAWRVSYSAAVIWIPVLFYRFVCVFCGLGRRVVSGAIFLTALSFAAVTPSPLFYKGARLAFESVFYAIPGPAFLACVAWWVVVVTLAHAELWRSYRHAGGTIRNQIKYFFLATSLGFTGGALGFLPKLGIDVYPWSYLGVPTYVVIMSYAIVRYNLMDIRVFLRRASLLVAVYIALIVAVSPFVVALHRSAATNVSPGLTVVEILAVSCVLSVGPMLYAFLVRSSAYFQESSIAGLTHELKSPLAAIEGALELMQDSKSFSSMDPARRADYFRMIERNCDRLGRSINDLLGALHTDGAAGALETSAVDLRDLCQSVAGAFQLQAANKGLRIELSIPSASITAFCDRERLGQALSNVVSNAVKYSTSGTVRIELTADAGASRIRVEDQGMGIPPDELPRVFDRLFQGRGSRGGRGSGLGLSIARTWIEAHGGRIWAESAGEGKGTTVTFTVPWK